MAASPAPTAPPVIDATTIELASVRKSLVNRDPLGPVQSAVSWVMLAAARRERGDRPSIPTVPAAQDSNGESVGVNSVLQSIDLDDEAIARPAAAVASFTSALGTISPFAAAAADNPIAVFVEQIQAFVTQIVQAVTQVVAEFVRAVTQAVTAVINVFVPAPDPVNAAPVAIDPTVGAPDPVTGVVIGKINVTDSDADPLTYAAPANAAKGSVSINATTGAFTYSPTEVARINAASDAANATDAFSVTVTDGKGGSTTVLVRVAISPASEMVPPDPPSANRAPVAGTPVVGSPDALTGVVVGSATAADADGDPLNYAASTASKGAVTMAEAGSFTYRPSATARHSAARDGATASDTTDSFSIVITDGKGGSTVVTVSVAVSPVNAAPVMGVLAVGTPNPLTGVVNGSISAVDADGDPLTYGGSATTAKGAVLVAGDGSFTYTPTSSARQNAAQTGATAADRSDNFTVTATDGFGGTTAIAVNVVISPAPQPANRAPLSGAISVGTPNAQTGVVSGSVTATDADGDQLVFTGPGSTPKGAVTVAANGAFTYTPTPTSRHAAASSGATLADTTDNFTITVMDGRGGIATVPVVVAVSPTNAAPVAGTPIIGAPNQSSGVVTGNAAATDANGDTLTYSGPATTAKGTVVVNSDGSFTYTPTAMARHGAANLGALPADLADSFTVTAVDGYGGTVTLPVTVPVSPANAAPVAGSPVVGTPNSAMGEVAGSVSATDANGDTLTYSGSAATARGAVVVNTDGSFVYTPTNLARQSATGSTTDTFTINVSDNFGGSTPIAVTVAVDPGTPSAGSASVGSPNVTTGVVVGGAVFSDSAGRVLSYSVSGSSAGGGSVTINALTGEFVFTPTQGQRQAAMGATTDTFVVTADNGVRSATQTITVAVDPGTPSAGSASVGSPNVTTGVVTGGSVFSDSAGRALSYTVSGSSAGGGSVSIDPSTGAFVFTPTQGQRQAATGATTDTFTVTASNGVRTATQPVTVSVCPVPNTVIATITVGGIANDVVVSPDGRRLYVSRDAGSGAGALTVIDTDPTSGTYSTVTATVALGKAATSLVVSPNGGRVYVAQYLYNTNGLVSVINTASGTVETTYTAGYSGANDLVVTPDGNYIYVSNGGNGAGTISIFNTVTNASSYTGVGGYPRGLAITTDGSRVYLDNGSNIRSINTATNTIVDTYTGPYNPGAVPTILAVSPNGSRLYVAIKGDNEVYAYNTVTKTLANTITVTGATGMAVSPDGRYVYVSNQTAKTVSVIDTTTNTVLGNIGVGSATGIAVSPDGKYIYVSNQGDGTVSVIFTGN